MVNRLAKKACICIVPMVMWFSPEFARDRGLDETCLRHRAGQYTDHDALFPV
ncbi:hypothetical protein XGA_2862 [Xanthomonas hortorum ATCC 19865]|nr:hypothetical protein XGA_2862 [Xanthomonas hortorum ATCC 19865]